MAKKVKKPEMRQPIYRIKIGQRYFLSWPMKNEARPPFDMVILKLVRVVKMFTDGFGYVALEDPHKLRRCKTTSVDIYEATAGDIRIVKGIQKSFNDEEVDNF